MHLLNIIEFIGRFHPVLVHLPIGILLIALLMQWLHLKKRANISQEVIRILLVCGMLAAFISCVTGWMLSTAGGYEESLVGWHMWMGIAVAFSSLLIYMKVARSEFDGTYKSLSVVMLGLILVTGHLGGSLTHGEDYLLGGGKEETDSVFVQTPIPNIQEALVYTDVVEPMLRTKCYTCHGATKQKGKLRMDNPQWLMKGGKDGPIIVPSAALESELIKRLLLPEGDEHHMPPKDKPQLKEKQVALLHWWIDAGADFTRRVKEVPQPEKIRPLLLGLQSDHVIVEKKSLPDIPLEPVVPAQAEDLAALRARGITVLPVSQNSNYLQANFVTATNTRNSDLEALAKIKKQLVWLKLGSTAVGDSAMKYIAQCENLTVLQLNNTAITNAGLAQIKDLPHLVSLNLVGTGIDGSGLEFLQSIKSLKAIYLYQTKVNKGDWARLQSLFKTAVLDSGGYVVPTLVTDTQVVKPPEIKK